MIDPFATPDPLRKWLEGFKPHEIVGRRSSECDCPIARYLSSLGWKDVRVTRYNCTDLRDGVYRTINISKAFRLFIQNIDRGHTHRPRIQARTALRILAEVTQ